MSSSRSIKPSLLEDRRSGFTLKSPTGSIVNLPSQLSSGFPDVKEPGASYSPVAAFENGIFAFRTL